MPVAWFWFIRPHSRSGVRALSWIVGRAVRAWSLHSGPSGQPVSTLVSGGHCSWP